MNVRYPYGNEKILTGEIPWLTAPIKVLLIGTNNYTYSDVHQHLSDIPIAARIQMSGTLTGRTATLGVADANDVLLPAVPAGQNGDAIVVLHDTGLESTSVLIAYLNDGVGLPVSPDGSNIEINWDNAANKIFKL
jgi:hypothetical protein